MQAFTDIKALIIDMDGVLWHGNKPVPGLKVFFATLRALKLPFILATNNASLTAAQYVVKLAAMGVTVSVSEILTSGIATALYLKNQMKPQATKIFVVGEAGAIEPLLAQGFSLTDLYEIKSDHARGADIVVCGKDETLTWAKLATATLNIRAGAWLVGTNADVTLPTERGVTHGNGAILAALEAATGVKAFIVGKPEPIMYQQALALLNVAPEYAVAIGDRLDTDILGAVRAKMRSILVLSGISTREDLKLSTYQPTWVLPDITAVTQALCKH